MIALFAHTRDVERFLELPQPLFERLSMLLAPPPTGGGPRSSPRLQSDLRQSLCLIATRTAGRGVTAAMRERGGRVEVQNSPFYQLIFATQELVGAPDATAAASSLRGVESGDQQLPQRARPGAAGHGDHRGQRRPGARPAEY